MTIESNNANKLSYKDKFEQRITFATKVKSKSAALSGGTK
jgi:hypothetical protein